MPSLTMTTWRHYLDVPKAFFFGNGTTAAEAAERREATDTVENTEPRMDTPA
jgi:hypothetical protein